MERDFEKAIIDFTLRYDAYNDRMRRWATSYL